jgi:oxalate---CoA ligase
MTPNAATMMELLAAGADDATPHTAPPHDKLGEEVAVVRRDGTGTAAAELRDHAALADLKVPKKVVFRPEIPKGATGKLLRIGLAQKLGLA